MILYYMIISNEIYNRKHERTENCSKPASTAPPNQTERHHLRQPASQPNNSYPSESKPISIWARHMTKKVYYLLLCLRCHAASTNAHVERGSQNICIVVYSPHEFICMCVYMLMCVIAWNAIKKHYSKRRRCFRTPLDCMFGCAGKLKTSSEVGLNRSEDSDNEPTFSDQSTASVVSRQRRLRRLDTHEDFIVWVCVCCYSWWTRMLSAAGRRLHTCMNGSYGCVCSIREHAIRSYTQRSYSLLALFGWPENAHYSVANGHYPSMFFWPIDDGIGICYSIRMFPKIVKSFTWISIGVSQQVSE